MSFDFSWGEPFCVREALKQYYKNRGFFFDIDQGKYSPNMGDEKLVELTKQFLRETTGIDYKYVIIHLICKMNRNLEVNNEYTVQKSFIFFTSIKTYKITDI